MTLRLIPSSIINVHSKGFWFRHYETVNVTMFSTWLKVAEGALVRRKTTEVDIRRSVTVADSKRYSVITVFWMWFKCLAFKHKNWRGVKKKGTKHLESTCFTNLWADPQPLRNNYVAYAKQAASHVSVLFFSYFSDVTQRGHVRRYDFHHEKCDWLQLSRLLRMTNGVVVQLQAFQLNLLLKFFFPPVVELVLDET